MKRAGKTLQYAIVDIETTGGYASGSGITEVSILIHNGKSVIDRYESLINPLRPIPLSIQAMTGITDEMVADSPPFEALASEIYQLLDGRIFVAHNVNFDYSFLKFHLSTAGYHLSSPKLCTVRLSRKIRPGLSSYSLGRLCDALGIPIVNRHRASGDAEATAILFTKLIEWDVDGAIQDMVKKTSKDQQLPPNLPKEQFMNLPHSPGVYYFHNKSGRVVYIGKARDIRNRVTQHFSGHSPDRQRQHFLREIHSISYERCGTELMAFLLEAAEIKHHWPVYNRALKRFEPKYALYAYEDRNSYLRLAVGKYGNQQHIHVFHRQVDAINLLHRLIREFNLYPELCVFGVRSRDVGRLQKPAARPTTDALPEMTPAAYNARVHRALDHLTHNLPTFAIVEKGRCEGELSCILVDNGCLYGMGYLSHDIHYHVLDDVKDALKRHNSNYYMMQLIYEYAEKHPSKVWVPDQQAITAFFNPTAQPPLP
ncbi:exonuclease domain-containing protein [Parapedobacter deserti]|uniref:Exonuclease domain-containing protein n=1 Tax=Parapedobacter deserti TaxID=1912957 RepID=A0ABV7JI68_9SPHI